MNFRTFYWIIILFVASTYAHSWFKTSEPPISDPSQPFRDASAFFEGFFNYFNLPKPSQIPECFSPDTASSFFKELNKAHKLLVAMNNREVLPLRSEFFKQYLFGIVHPSLTACIALTQDFDNLLKELGIHQKDPELFANANFLYSQAYFVKLLDNFEPMMENFEAKDYYPAGKAYGKLINDLVNSIKNEGLGYLAIKGFSNGFDTLGEVKDSENLLSESSIYLGGVAMELLKELTNVISEGESEQAYENNVNFWKGKGKEILEQIPSFVWRLGLVEGKDLTEVVGNHILNWIYDEKRMKYIQEHQMNYYTRMKLIGDNLNHLHVIQAGYLYADFIKGIDTSS